MIKYLWGIRALFFSLFWGSFKTPSYIGKPIFIKGSKNIFVGKRVRIYPHARIEVVNKNGLIQIEDNVSIGQNLHLTAGLKIKICKNTTISSNVLITDLSHSYEKIGVHIMEQKTILKETIVGANCFIGTGVIIDCGTILGENCIVGSNSVLKGVYPKNSVIVGVPGRIVKRYNDKTHKWEKTN